jgi:YaiO family outer membrane protein
MGLIRKTLPTAAGMLVLASSTLAAQVGPERPDTAPRLVAPDEEARPSNRASVEYGYVHLSGGADPWQQVTGELSRRMRPGTLVGRVNLAERFGESGVQVEADAYPRISERVYGYVNAGYSEAEIFPEWRLGAELYGTVARGWEASAGFRRLEFTDESVTLYTGSVGRYQGSWYFSARPFVTPDDGETSVSGTVLARRYYGDGRSFATLVAGAGTAPTEAPIQFELQRANTLRLGAYGTAALRRRLGLRWSLGWEKEELTEATDRTRINAGIGAEVAF